jgi:hypothetical protein
MREIFVCVGMDVCSFSMPVRHALGMFFFGTVSVQVCVCVCVCVWKTERERKREKERKILSER